MNEIIHTTLTKQNKTKKGKKLVYLGLFYSKVVKLLHLKTNFMKNWKKKWSDLVISIVLSHKTYGLWHYMV